IDRLQTIVGYHRYRQRLTEVGVHCCGLAATGGRGDRETLALEGADVHGVVADARLSALIREERIAIGIDGQSVGAGVDRGAAGRRRDGRGRPPVYAEWAQAGRRWVEDVAVAGGDAGT